MLLIYPRCPVRLLSKASFAERREDSVTRIGTIKLLYYEKAEHKDTSNALMK